MLKKQLNLIWIGTLVFLLSTFYSSFILATTFDYDAYLVDGLSYDNYQKGLNLSISQRISSFRALDYIDTTLLPPLEASKQLTEEIRGALTFITDANNFDTYQIQSQWGVDQNYVNTISSAKQTVQKDLISKIDEWNLIKTMINTVMKHANSSIASFQTKMSLAPSSTPFDFTALDSTLTDNEQIPLRRFLNDGSATYYHQPPDTLVKQIRNHISGGEYHFMMMLPNGKVYTTGSDPTGQGVLGRNSVSQIKYNVSIALPPSTIVYQIETNYRSNIILTNNGVFTFGSNSYGQLGTGNRVSSFLPVKVNGFLGKQVVQVAAGSESMYAITNEGELWAWGVNTRGQLGDATLEDKYRPFKVLQTSGPLQNKRVIKVCAGDSFAMALTSDNVLVGFGDNSAGQLGIGLTVPDFKAFPVVVPLTGVLSGKNISDVHCGSRHVFIQTTDGKIISWGYNGYGQLGDNSVSTKVAPQLLSISACDLPKRIYTKFHSTIIICNNNKMFGFGRNSNGEIGLGASGYLQVPTQYSQTTEFVDSIIDLSTSSVGSSAILLRDGSIYYAGSTFSTTVFRSIALVYNTHTKDIMYNNIYLPWYLRQSPFFTLNNVAYLFKSSKSVYSRNGFEFKIFTSTNPDDMNASWKQVNGASMIEKSIYSTHYVRSNEYIYFMGGFVNNEITNSIYRAPITDPLNGWQLMNQTLPFPLASGMVMTYNGYVYIIGGIKQTNLFNSSRDIDPYEQVILSQSVIRSRLDSDMKDWEIMYNNKFPITLHSAFVYRGSLDSKYYIMGGLRSLTSSPSTSVYRLNSNLNWDLVSQLPFNVNSGSGILSQNSNSVLLTGTSSLGIVGPNMSKTLVSSFPTGWTTATSTSSVAMCSKYPTFCN